MATAANPTATIDGEQTADHPRLRDLASDEVLRCRNDDGVTWYFGIEGLGAVRYHQWSEFEREHVYLWQVAAIRSHPAVDTAVVSREQLDVLRGEGGGE